MDSYYKVSSHLSVQTSINSMYRFHYQEYLLGCKEKGIELKAQLPTNFNSDNQFIFKIMPSSTVLSPNFFRMQVKIDTFTTAIKKPPITKAGLKEFLLELIADADLVSIYLLFRSICFSIPGQQFHFVECESFHHTLWCLYPRLNNCGIPQRTCLGSAVAKKIKRLDEINQDIIQVSLITSDMPNLCMICLLEYIITCIPGVVPLVNEVLPPVC